MSRWTEDHCWELLKRLSPPTAARVGNRVCRGVNFAGCSAKVISGMLSNYSKNGDIPTEEELTEAILIEVFGSLKLPGSVLKKIQPKE